MMNRERFFEHYMSKELEALDRIKNTMEVGLKNVIYIEEINEFISLNKEELLKDFETIEKFLKEYKTEMERTK